MLSPHCMRPLQPSVGMSLLTPRWAFLWRPGKRRDDLAQLPRTERDEIDDVRIAEEPGHVSLSG